MMCVSCSMWPVSYLPMVKCNFLEACFSRIWYVMVLRDKNYSGEKRTSGCQFDSFQDMRLALCC